MADDSSTPFEGESSGGTPRGGRAPGNREGGGFRIRLSDNEMQAARAVQEAFGLRSIVAVLGFSLRTLAQQLEEGQLDELIARHRAQGGPRGAGGRREDRRRERGEPAGRSREARVDPFARPSRPAPAAPAGEEHEALESPSTEPPAGEEAPVAEPPTEEAAPTAVEPGNAA